MNLEKITIISTITFHITSLIISIGTLAISNFNFEMSIAIYVLKVLSMLMLLGYIFTKNSENIIFKIYLPIIIIIAIILHIIITTKFNNLTNHEEVYNYYGKYEKISTSILEILTSSLILYHVYFIQTDVSNIYINIIGWILILMYVFMYYLKNRIYVYFITDG